MTVGAAVSVKSQAVALMDPEPVRRASREADPEANPAHVAGQDLQAARDVQRAAHGPVPEVGLALVVAPAPPRRVDLDPEAVHLNQIRVDPGLEVERPRAKGRELFILT